MATEESPRLSFSDDPSPSPTLRLDDCLPVDDFGFSTGFDSSSTPADLLFSQGKLLPLYKSSPPRITKRKEQTLRELLSKVGDDDNDNTSCISVGSNIVRSSSVSGDNAKTGAKIRPFSRSKSTGCNPSKSRKQGATAKAYYYCGGDRRASFGNGVRINPVINVPAPFTPRGGSTGSGGGGGRSFFAYLLCICKDKTMEMSLGFSRKWWRPLV